MIKPRRVASTCSCHGAADGGRLVAVRSAKGTGFLFSENLMNEGWWKNMNGTADATAKVNVFMQEVDDVDDYMDEDEGGGATSPPPAAVAARPARVAGAVAVARAPRVEHAARRRCRFHRHRHR